MNWRSTSLIVVLSALLLVAAGATDSEQSATLRHVRERNAPSSDDHSGRQSPLGLWQRGVSPHQDGFASALGDHRRTGRSVPAAQNRSVIEGKVAFVTGSSRGIGCAIAERLAKDGALAVVRYGHNAEARQGNTGMARAARSVREVQNQRIAQ